MMTDGDNLFLVLCDKSLSKEARTVRKWLADCQYCPFIIQTVRQVWFVEPHQQFEEKLNHLLTSWSVAVIVLTSANFAAYIDDGKTNENLPELLIENHPQCQKVLKEFFTNDSEQVRSKVIVITVNGDAMLPQCLSHVQPITKGASKDVFVDKITRLLVDMSNS